MTAQQCNEIKRIEVCDLGVSKALNLALYIESIWNVGDVMELSKESLNRLGIGGNLINELELKLNSLGIVYIKGKWEFYENNISVEI